MNLYFMEGKNMRKYEDVKKLSVGNQESKYMEMFQRMNLQAIGYFIKEGSMIQIDEDSFTKRGVKAEEELEKNLEELDLSQDLKNRVFDIISDYVFSKEEIQFSLGMKAGARLALLLTDQSEYDI